MLLDWTLTDNITQRSMKSRKKTFFYWFFSARTFLTPNCSRFDSFNMSTLTCWDDCWEFALTGFFGSMTAQKKINFHSPTPRNSSYVEGSAEGVKKDEKVYFKFINPNTHTRNISLSLMIHFSFAFFSIMNEKGGKRQKQQRYFLLPDVFFTFISNSHSLWASFVSVEMCCMCMQTRYAFDEVFIVTRICSILISILLFFWLSRRCSQINENFHWKVGFSLWKNKHKIHCSSKGDKNVTFVVYSQFTFH